MAENIKFLEAKIAHNQAQLDGVYPIKAELEKLNLDIGGEHINSAVTSIHLALAEIVEDSNRCHQLIKQSSQQGVAAELLPSVAKDIEDDAWVKGAQIP